MKKKKKLTRKFIFGFILIGVVISAISIIVGVNGFNNYIKKQYNDTAYDIAETVQTFFEDGELEAYTEMIKDPEKQKKSGFKELLEPRKYGERWKQINHLRESMGANDIYVVYVDMDALNEEDVAKDDWAPLHYLFDTFATEGKSYKFGDCGPFNRSFIKDARWQLLTYNRGTNYYISKSQFGYNTSALLPVRLDDLDNHVIIGVEIPMSTLQDAIRDLSLHTLGTIVIAMIIIILLFVYYLYRTVIRPIDIIAEETAIFGDSGNKLSERLPDVQTGDELQGLAESVLQMEQGILDYVKHITKVTAEKERISTELNVATDIQANMLPRRFPAFPERDEFDIYASMVPAKEVGGDFYDFFMVDDDHLAMVVGDVSGKGVPAALFMVIAKTLIKDRTTYSKSPKKILEEVNNLLCENNEAEMFVTVWLGIMQISTGKVVAANAGHEYPAVRKKDGTFELLTDRHGFVLGGIEGSAYREYEFQVDPGGSLFVYTDGVAEATSGEDELFGTERMLDALNTEPGAPPEQLVDQVQTFINDFVKDAPQFDDITMLSVERKQASAC